MTIIQPNKDNRKDNFYISVLMFSLVVSAVWGVFLYNQLVDIRHEINRQEVNLRRAEVMSAEFKNNLYNIIDNENLEASTNLQSLILDKNPEYVKSAKLTLN